MIASVLSDEQIKRIHETSLAILDRGAVLVPHEGAVSEDRERAVGEIVSAARRELGSGR